MRYMFRFSVGEKLDNSRKLGHYMVLDNDVELDHEDQLYYDKLDHGKRPDHDNNIHDSSRPKVLLRITSNIRHEDFRSPPPP